MPTRGLFITGTDTGVGKTYLAAAIVRRLRSRQVRVGAYKPAVSGSQAGPDGKPVWRDVELLWDAVGGEVPRDRICPQRFVAPLAPPVAAREEGKTVDSQLLRDGVDWWRDRVDILIVEGAGGLLSPIADSETVADLAADFGFPLIIVARLGLGTINHTLLTLQAAERRGLAMAGIVLNERLPVSDDRSVETNAAQIASLTETPVLTVIRHASPDELQRDPSFRAIDWSALAATHTSRT